MHKNLKIKRGLKACTSLTFYLGFYLSLVIPEDFSSIKTMGWKLWHLSHIPTVVRNFLYYPMINTEIPNWSYLVIVFVQIRIDCGDMPDFAGFFLLYRI